MIVVGGLGGALLLTFVFNLKLILSADPICQVAG
jgi:hypothetical protein